MADAITQMDQYEQVMNNAAASPTVLSSKDIFKLISASLKEGEPFATEFNDRVIAPLAKKIGAKLVVTDVVVDGKDIGKQVTKTIQTQLNAQVKSKLFSSLTKYVDDLSKPSTTATTLNLTTILGMPPEKGAILQLKYKLLQWKWMINAR